VAGYPIIDVLSNPAHVALAFNEIIEGAGWKTVSIPNVAPVKFGPSLLQTGRI
jgi:hypothetical protein